jgi:dihydroorotate dehydrogenase (NAD+) catalytic subunit
MSGRAPKEVLKEEVSQGKLAQDKISQDKLAPEKFAQDKQALDKLAPDKLAPDKLAKEELAKESLSSSASAKSETFKAEAGASTTPGPDLSVSIGPLFLKNPVIAASGVFGYGLELAAFCPPERLGAVIVKGLSQTPWPGNPGHRMIEAAGGLLNSIGLQNIGAEAFVKGPLKELKKTGAMVGANVIGRTVPEYVAASQIIADSQTDFIELNISCPNLASEGGLSFGADREAAGRLTEAVVKALQGAKPLWVKLPPLAADIQGLAKRLEEAGADALSLINTLPGLSINLETMRPQLGNVTGGLSGPPIKPLALRQVYLASRAVKIPVIGLGGVMEAEDALEFMAAGACAVQLGTAILRDPASPLKIIEDLGRWLARKGLKAVSDVTGSLIT